MAVCRKCGFELKPGKKFCTQCGTKIEDQTQTAKPTVSAQTPQTAKPPVNAPTSQTVKPTVNVQTPQPAKQQTSNNTSSTPDRAAGSVYKRTQGLAARLFSSLPASGLTYDDEKKLPINLEPTDAKEQYELAEVYFLEYRGSRYGIQEDKVKAVYWYTKSAEQGYANAQRSLGSCYGYGKGVSKDYKKMVYWYTKAAEQGNDLAQVWLGRCYEEGEGVEPSYKKAVYWYKKALAAGWYDAKKDLKRIKSIIGRIKVLFRKIRGNKNYA